MKSLSDTYVETHGGSHETFADLMFCALVVLVLFVMALAIEVSQRVRSEMVADLPDPEPVTVVSTEELSTMTKEEVEALSKELQTKSQEIANLKSQLQNSVQIVENEKQKVENQMAALSGEQRFTGAREPASLHMAYDYDDSLFYFLPAREVDHAETRNSGESNIDFSVRRTREMVAIALNARKQRGFPIDQAKAIYRGFSNYKEVKASLDSYEVVDSSVGIKYGTAQSAYIAGDTEVTATIDALVELRILEVYREKGVDSEDMYPHVSLQINLEKRSITINGVEMNARDAKHILLSISGRGAMIDLEGLKGKAPEWLKEEVLIPAGYISGVPKLPE